MQHRDLSIDGELVADARISVLDRGFLYGDGLFEVFPSWADVEPHLDRLYASAAALKLRVIDRGELARARSNASAATDQRIRVIVTRGPGRSASASATSVRPHDHHRRAARTAAARDVGRGRRLAASSSERRRRTRRSRTSITCSRASSPPRPAPTKRCGSTPMATSPSARAQICSSFEIIASVTPPLAGILPGITRARVLAWCRAHGIAAVEEAITRDALNAADELFATSAVRGVVAITQPRRSRRVLRGPITTQIADAINARPAI